MLIVSIVFAYFDNKYIYSFEMETTYVSLRIVIALDLFNNISACVRPRSILCGVFWSLQFSLHSHHLLFSLQYIDWSPTGKDSWVTQVILDRKHTNLFTFTMSGIFFHRMSLKKENFYKLLYALLEQASCRQELPLINEVLKLCRRIEYWSEWEGHNQFKLRNMYLWFWLWMSMKRWFRFHKFIDFTRKLYHAFWTSKYLWSDPKSWCMFSLFEGLI